MTATLGQIVADAQGIVGEVAGPGVQTFSEDRMMQDAIRAFNLVFKKHYWDQYMKWFRVLLDGTTGVMTTNALSNVLDYEDIKAVHRDGESQPMAPMSTRANPFRSSLSSGDRPVSWSALSATHSNYASRKIVVYPITSTGYINIHARTYPFPDHDWTPDSVVYFDRDLLAYGTAYMTLIGDDMNTNAADMARTLMEAKFKDIMTSLANRPISLSSGGDIPNQWTER